jgi:hypothetical protein
MDWLFWNNYIAIQSVSTLLAVASPGRLIVDSFERQTREVVVCRRGVGCLGTRLDYNGDVTGRPYRDGGASYPG